MRLCDPPGQAWQCRYCHCIVPVRFEYCPGWLFAEGPALEKCYGVQLRDFERVWLGTSARAVVKGQPVVRRVHRYSSWLIHQEITDDDEQAEGWDQENFEGFPLEPRRGPLHEERDALFARLRQEFQQQAAAEQIWSTLVQQVCQHSWLKVQHYSFPSAFSHQTTACRCHQALLS